MDFETDNVSGCLMCTTDLDNLHYHDILAPDKGFFHVEVGIADRPYPYKGVFLKRIRMQGDEDCFAMIDKGFAVGKERENIVGLWHIR